MCGACVHDRLVTWTKSFLFKMYRADLFKTQFFQLLQRFIVDIYWQRFTFFVCANRYVMRRFNLTQSPRFTIVTNKDRLQLCSVLTKVRRQCALIKLALKLLDLLKTFFACNHRLKSQVLLKCLLLFFLCRKRRSCRTSLLFYLLLDACELLKRWH